MKESVLYARVPRLLQELLIARGDGSHRCRFITLARLSVLLLDDWAYQPLEKCGRDDLREVMDIRAELRATIINAQLPHRTLARLDRRADNR